MLKRSLKALVSSVAIIGSALIVAINAPQIHNNYLRYEVGESTVQVLIGANGGGGTGFAIKTASGKDVIATNRHVCEASQGGWMLIKSNEKSIGWKKIIYKDNIHDLCLLEGDSRLAPLELASAPEKGDIHYVIGYPGLRPLTVASGEYIGNGKVELLFDVAKREQCPGKVYDLDPFQQIFFGVEFVCVRSYKAYQTTATTYPGNSGSPVVNKYGNVIAVLFAGSTQQEKDNYLVPGYELERVLSKF